MTDSELIHALLIQADDLGWSLKELAAQVGMSYDWASKLVRGDIARFNRATRLRVQETLGLRKPPKK